MAGTSGPRPDYGIDAPRAGAVLVVLGAASGRVALRLGLALPGLPGGLGIGEAGFAGLYGWLGCTPGSGSAASLMQRVLNFAIGVPGLILYLRMRSALPHPETTRPEPAETEAVSAV